MQPSSPQIAPHKGRGATFNPPNRFEPLELEIEPEALEDGELPGPKTQYFIDATRDILSKNDSPDIPFTYGLNPYRGCEHGCVYCYARPTHEYLGFSAGLDFESKIVIKPDAPELLAQTFRSARWQPQVISLSGNTDCYQPVERVLKLTRRCLEVFLLHRNPVSMITKSSLITRDIDLLQELAAMNLVSTCVSITTLRSDLASKMEPRASVPEKRLEAIAKLAAAGVPVGVNVAPIIPGLNDHEIPAIIRAAAEVGATHAGHILMRLPHSVKDLFCAWVKQHFPDRATKVIHAIMDTRNGQLNDPRFGSRFSGEGNRAEAIHRLHRVACEKYGMNKNEWPHITTAHFRRHAIQGQGELFG